MYEVEVVGLAELERELQRLGGSLIDLSGLWERLYARFRGWIGDQFASSGAWAGARWAPLSPRYAAWKASHEPGRSLLVASGELERSAEHPEAAATPHTLTLAIDSPIYRFHQRGTRKMPARPLVPLSLPFRAERELEEELIAYVRARVRGGGLLA